MPKDHKRPLQAVPDAANSRTLDWIAPSLFGLLLYVVILFHSSSWTTTLPEVVALFAGVGGILFVLTRARERLRVPRSIALCLLLVGISAAISTLGSADIAMSLPRLLLYVSMGLLSTMVYLLYRDAGRIPLATYCVVIALVEMPYIVAVIWQLKQADGTLFKYSTNVVHFANVRHFGHVCFLAAMGGAAAIVLSRAFSVLSFALMCLALFGIIAVGSRGPLLAWMLFMGLLLWFGPERRRLAACGLVALVGTSALVWWLDTSGLLLTPNIFGRVEQQLDGAQTVDSGRLQLWLGSLREVAAHPLFGQGPEAYELSGCCDRWVAHPHNFILQLLMEFGLVGCAVVVVVLVCTLRLIGGMRSVRDRVVASTENQVLIAMLAAYAALGLIDGMFYFAVPLVHFALFCGLLAGGLRHASNSCLPGQSLSD